MHLTHIEQDGKAAMVDVSHKGELKRTALASGKIVLQESTLHLIHEGMMKKGDVLACARIAGITGGKKTADLIPLCHNIFIDQITVDFEYLSDGIGITASTVCVGKTGIEMEALTAVSVAALTIYDMCKAVDKEMVIDNITLISKEKEEL